MCSFYIQIIWSPSLNILDPPLLRTLKKSAWVHILQHTEFILQGILWSILYIVKYTSQHNDFAKASVLQNIFDQSECV